MRISDVARKTGLSISAIRYYERRSVIRSPNRNGRNRDYSEDDVRVLRFVRNARSLNIPVGAIASILQRPWQRGEMAEVIAEHRQEVQSQIEALREVDTALAHLENCTCEGVLDCELGDGDD